MAATIDEGFGIALAGASDVLSGDLRNISWNGVERNALDTSHAGTSSGKMTFQPSDLINYGTWEPEGLYKPDTEPALDGDAAETWTIDFPVATGQSTGVDIAATAMMTAFSASLPYDGLMTFQSTLKLSGDITVTAST